MRHRRGGASHFFGVSMTMVSALASRRGSGAPIVSATLLPDRRASGPKRAVIALRAAPAGSSASSACRLPPCSMKPRTRRSAPARFRCSRPSGHRARPRRAPPHAFADRHRNHIGRGLHPREMSEGPLQREAIVAGAEGSAHKSPSMMARRRRRSDRCREARVGPRSAAHRPSPIVAVAPASIPQTPMARTARIRQSCRLEGCARAFRKAGYKTSGDAAHVGSGPARRTAPRLGLGAVQQAKPRLRRRTDGTGNPVLRSGPSRRHAALGQPSRSRPI